MLVIEFLELNNHKKTLFRKVFFMIKAVGAYEIFFLKSFDKKKKEYNYSYGKKRRVE